MCMAPHVFESTQGLIKRAKYYMQVRMHAVMDGCASTYICMDKETTECLPTNSSGGGIKGFAAPSVIS